MIPVIYPTLHILWFLMIPIFAVSVIRAIVQLINRSRSKRHRKWIAFGLVSIFTSYSSLHLATPHMFELVKFNGILIIFSNQMSRFTLRTPRLVTLPRKKSFTTNIRSTIKCSKSVSQAPTCLMRLQRSTVRNTI